MHSTTRSCFCTRKIKKNTFVRHFWVQKRRKLVALWWEKKNKLLMCITPLPSLKFARTALFIVSREESARTKGSIVQTHKHKVGMFPSANYFWLSNIVLKPKVHAQVCGEKVFKSYFWARFFANSFIAFHITSSPFFSIQTSFETQIDRLPFDRY